MWVTELLPLRGPLKVLYLICDFPDGFAHVDEVVGDTLGIGGEGEVLCAHVGTANAGLKAFDVIVLHGLGNVVNLLLDDVGLFEGVKALLLVGDHDSLVQIADARLHLPDSSMASWENVWLRPRRLSAYSTMFSA